MTIIKQFNEKGYIKVKHSNKLIFKKLYNSIDDFTNKIIYENHLSKRYINFLVKNDIEDCLYAKINFLKSSNPHLHGKLYRLLQKHNLLSDLYADKNIISALEKISRSKNLFRLFQTIRLDLSPDYHHALPWHQDFFDVTKKINLSDCYTIWTPITKLLSNTGGLEIMEGSHKKILRQKEIQKKDKNQSNELELNFPKNFEKFHKQIKINLNSNESLIMSMSLVHRTIKGTSKGLRVTALTRLIPDTSKSINSIFSNI